MIELLQEKLKPKTNSHGVEGAATFILVASQCPVTVALQYCGFCITNVANLNEREPALNSLVTLTWIILNNKTTGR